MCDAQQTLEQLKHQQVKPKPLLCTANTQCWCNKVKDFRYSAEFEWTECMSPAEMLERHEDELSKRDKKYLESLLWREFTG